MYSDSGFRAGFIELAKIHLPTALIDLAVLNHSREVPGTDLCVDFDNLRI
jgi:hypothetical protein